MAQPSNQKINRTGENHQITQPCGVFLVLLRFQGLEALVPLEKTVAAFCDCHVLFRLRAMTGNKVN